MNSPTDDMAEVREQIDKVAQFIFAGTLSPYGATDYMIQIIEAQKRLAALDGAIEERNAVALDNYRGHTFSESTNWQGKFDKFISNNEKRLESLKKLREGL